MYGDQRNGCASANGRRFDHGVDPPTEALPGSGLGRPLVGETVEGDVVGRHELFAHVRGTRAVVVGVATGLAQLWRECGYHGPVVGAGVIGLNAGVVGDGRERCLAGGDVGDRVAQGVADQEVVDQLPPSAVDAGVPLRFGDECGEIPEPGAVTGVAWS